MSRRTKNLWGFELTLARHFEYAYRSLESAGRGLLGVPGNAGELLLARLPFVSAQDAWRDVDQAGDEPEHGGGVPGSPGPGPVVSDVKRIRHAREGDILNNELGEEFQCLHLQRVVLQVVAIRGDPETKRNFFGSDGFLRRLVRGGKLHFAFPFEGD